ncbi:MAG: hypothetical protein ACPGPS_21680, partial [Rubripirellula sp.]
LAGCEALTITEFLQPNLRFGINGKGGWQRIDCQPATHKTPLCRTGGIVLCLGFFGIKKREAA